MTSNNARRGVDLVFTYLCLTVIITGMVFALVSMDALQYGSDLQIKLNAIGGIASALLGLGALEIHEQDRKAKVDK
jgi:hypothetical protein